MAQTSDLAASSTNNFGTGLLSAIAQQASAPSSQHGAAGESISPFSITLALALLVNGAAPESATFRELVDAIIRQPMDKLGGPQAALTSFNAASKALLDQITGDASEGLEIAVANSAWVAKSQKFSQAYSDSIKSSVGAEALQLESAQQVNSWVSKATNDKIKNIVDEDIVQQSVFVLINAVYFKGTWSHPFTKDATMPDEFTAEGGSKLQVNMMHRQAKDIQFNEDNGKYQAVRLPYKGDKFAAVLLLPDESQASDRSAVVSTLGAALVSICAQDSCWATTEGGIDLFVPSFKLEAAYELAGVLPKLGINAAFKASGDLAGVTDSNVPVSVSNVIHKTFVEVNEEGTEAAAASAIAAPRAFVMPTAAPKLVKFNRPFMFAIQHVPSGTLVFLTYVAQPDSASSGAATGGAAGDKPVGYPGTG